MLKRVDELTEELLKKAFPDAYRPPPQDRPVNSCISSKKTRRIEDFVELATYIICKLRATGYV